MRELTIHANAENLPAVHAFIEEGLSSLECDPSRRKQLDVAVEEIFSNISSYAYAPETGLVKISMEVDPATACAQVRFCDFGIRFDPLAKPDPNLDDGLKARKRGGLGIFMVKRQVDRVAYEYADGRNVLTIEKKLL